MSEKFGNGVSRTLSAIDRQFSTVVWQKGKPPLDSELNLMSQVDVEQMQQQIRSCMNSGFIIDPTRSAQDFMFKGGWSNHFYLGQEDGSNQPFLYANVAGMIVPVCGTEHGAYSNRIKLNPPPATDSRVDFVFLEVWKTLVAPNPSTVNKPSATTIWKYGNTEYGGTNIVDDLEDPNIGFETSERVQIQYRIRVYGSGAGLGAGVALQEHPDGLGDPNILGQGTASTPVAALPFANMQDTLSDPSLWRAGDGNPDNGLGTVDGYVYAIPICAVFRRNSNPFVAVNISGNANQNGALNRTPSSAYLANPREGAKLLTSATLKADLTSSATGVVEVEGLIGSGLDDSRHTVENLHIRIGSEIIGLSAINITSPNLTLTLSQRGRYGTSATAHLASSPIQFFNTNPNGKFADEIAKEDLLDLRRSVTMGEWDYHRILQHNLGLLLKGELHSTYKRAAVGDTEGPIVTEVSYLFSDGTTDVPLQTEAMDGTDGIRTVFSDSAVLQRDVTILLDNDVTLLNGATQDQFDTNVGWDVAPDFKPSGFLNNEGANGTFTNGSIIFLHIGGEDGTSGARNTFRDGSEKAVRFVSPREFWKTGYPVIDPLNGNQYPVTLRALELPSHNPKPYGEESFDPNAALKRPGPMYPSRAYNFEYPFIVLGGVLHATLKTTVSTLNTNLVPFTTYAFGNKGEIDLGINFDTVGGYYHKDSNNDFTSDASLVTSPMIHGERTLWDMLTDYGRDTTGQSSEVYLVLYGDNTANARENNGVFKVVGVGTAGYTMWDAANATSVVVEALDTEFTNWETTSSATLTAEFRSQHTHSLDGNGFTLGSSALCIALTDIQGLKGHRWAKSELEAGSGSPLDYSVPTANNDGTDKGRMPSKICISTTLLYEPNRGAMARVPDKIHTVALTNGSSDYLRESKGGLDSTFSAATGTPAANIEFDAIQAQLWNALPALGWHAPDAPSYGGRVIANSEQDRENEVLFDRGSKSLVIRPYRSRQMTVHCATSATTNTMSLIGSYAYPNGTSKDGLTLFSGTATSGKQMAFALPPEVMPKFGRQDIPMNTGSGNFLAGINHLFVDSTTLNNPVFKIIGGEDNISGGNQVKPLFFRTDTPASYGVHGTSIGGVLNKPFYHARKSTDIATVTDNEKAVVAKFTNVRSSDLGAGLKGIQLPPYLGVARIYGVYDYDDYIAKGGVTFAADRTTMEADSATNLLRMDNHKQTLFIMQDGALDLTGENGDHTYIIPENVIDTTLSPNHKFNDSTSVKEKFEDFNYIVECVIFGFAKEWINGNNYVLMRNHDAQGNILTDFVNPSGGPTDFQLEDLNMVFPCAAALSNRFYTTYSRTVYQGDPYMSRNGSTRTITDCERRYGQIPVASAYQVKTPVQQFDSNGNGQIETPNARAFQVMASVDFYTSMGTGKFGGQLYPGTFMDVGYFQTDKSRIPSSSTANRLQTVTRAFSESQLTNTSRATALIQSVPTVEPSAIDWNDAWFPASLGYAAAIEGLTFEFTRLDGLKVWVRLLENLSGGIAIRTHEVKMVTKTITQTAEVDIEFGTLEPLDDPLAVNDSQSMKTIDNQGFGDFTISRSDMNIDAYAHTACSVSIEPNLFGSSSQYPPPVIYHAWVDSGDGSGSGAMGKLKVSATSSAPTEIGPLTLPPVSYTITMVSEVVDMEATFKKMAYVVNNSEHLNLTCTAHSDGTYVEFESIVTGEQGNDLQLEITHPTAGFSPTQLIRLISKRDNRKVGAPIVTKVNFTGGKDLPVNAGDGVCQMNLTGMTERLPLGLLMNDSDFLCENILNDKASALQTFPSNIRPLQTLLPLTENGEEVSRFLSIPSEMITMCDGGILGYTPYHNVDNPSGTKKFRIFRGGGSAMLLGGQNPGGPIDWVSGSFSSSLQPVLKGGILAAKALLVRNFAETAFTEPTQVSAGDELQMIIMTYGFFGSPSIRDVGINIGGKISPSGYGDGYAACDRYRICGKPMFAPNSQHHPDPMITPVPYIKE